MRAAEQTSTDMDCALAAHVPHARCRGRGLSGDDDGVAHCALESRSRSCQLSWSLSASLYMFVCLVAQYMGHVMVPLVLCDAQSAAAQRMRRTTDVIKSLPAAVTLGAPRTAILNIGPASSWRRCASTRLSVDPGNIVLRDHRACDAYRMLHRRTDILRRANSKPPALWLRL